MANFRCSVIPECGDSSDNDGDGSIDLEDYGCVSQTDASEENNGNTQCSDGTDNDADGSIDQDDSECSSRTDNSESPPKSIKPEGDDSIDSSSVT